MYRHTLHVYVCVSPLVLIMNIENDEFHLNDDIIALHLCMCTGAVAVHA